MAQQDMAVSANVTAEQLAVADHEAVDQESDSEIDAAGDVDEEVRCFWSFPPIMSQYLSTFASNLYSFI